MTGKIIIEKTTGAVEVKNYRHSEHQMRSDLNAAMEKYEYIAAEWNYTAKAGNPINYYFREKE